MSAADLRRIGLEPEQAFAAVTFHQRYAATAITESEAWAGALDAPAATFPLHADPLFEVAADAACSLRDAAQWLLLLDVEGGRELLLRAAEVFVRAGLPYGLYLQAVAGAEPDAEAVAAMLAAVRGDEPPETGQLAVAAYPQQQAYLMLAAAGSPGLRGSFGDELRGLLLQSPLRDGVMPWGALGTPLRLGWAAAGELFEDASDSPRSPVTELLRGLCQDYERGLESARVNDYLWQNAAAPVDVADLELLGVACLAARRWGSDAVWGRLRDQLAINEESIAAIPVRTGFALADVRG